ncbi:trihelix transcription factor ASR3-like isoform X2 [Miscanthus floridulus]|uniref:trihelix transcription factor ASR3-like isoform X2 n=1 Tax=Miscanthus floridulus TaxID=154761 RepID=UPI00345B436C
MDPAAADQPCVIQALPANCNTLPPLLVQALPAQHSPAKTNNTPPSPAAKRRPAPAPPGPAPPSPRRTRSGGAPEWTPAETLALVAEVAAVDDGWSRSVSAFQKWAMVAENLAASEAFASGPRTRRGRGSGSGSKRTAGECRRRWEALAAEYGAVRRWEVRTRGTYWEMGAAARRKAGLPAEFDAEVYGAMDALIRVEEALLADAAGGGAGGEEVEGLVGGGAGVGVEVGEQDGGHSGEAEVGKEQVQEDASAGEEEEPQEEKEEEEEEDVEEDGEEMQEDGGNADASNDLASFGFNAMVR